MKLIKSMAVLSLCAALTLTATSCQLSRLLGDDEETTTLGPLMTFTLPAAETTPEPIDMMETDLSQYVTLANYKGLTVTDKAEPVTDETLTTALNEFINSVTLYREITDRDTAQGDTIVMDYEGKLDGVAFSGGTAQGQSIVLSENSGYIEGFAEGLIGVKPGSTVDLTLTFPTDYHATDMAGKTVVFTVTVHYIQGEKIAPELTDEFIALATGGDYTTVDAFRTYYREYLEVQSVSDAHSEALNTLWSMVFENSKFSTLPTQQVSYYVAQSKAQYEAYAQTYGMTYDDFAAAVGISDETLQVQAESYVKQDLVLYSLVKAEGLSITDEEYTAGVEKYAENAGVIPAEIEAYYGEEYLREALLWDEMMEMLYFYAVVEK